MPAAHGEGKVYQRLEFLVLVIFCDTQTRSTSPSFRHPRSVASGDSWSVCQRIDQAVTSIVGVGDGDGDDAAAGLAAWIIIFRLIAARGNTWQHAKRDTRPVKCSRL